VGPLLFDRYRLLAPAGRGGTAEVWRARDARTGETVAVKRLHPVVFGSEAGRERLVREFRALRDLDHPNIVRVRDLEIGTDEAALVLDFVDGESLRDRLAGGARLDPGLVATIAGDVAAALDAAHAAGLVHRDVSPGNVLLEGTDPPRARLTDFGIARATADETGVTATGSLVGTLRYVAPELLRGEPATAASDVYGLAAIVYEMLAGRPAFGAPTPVALVDAHRTGPPPIAGVDPALDEVVRQGLADAPGERPRSAGAFAAAIAAASHPPAEPAAEDAVTAVVPLPTVIPQPEPAQVHATAAVPVRPVRGTTRSRSDQRRAAPLAAAAIGALLVGALGVAALGGAPRDTEGDPAATAPPARAADATPAAATPGPEAATPPPKEAVDPGAGGDPGQGKDKDDDKPGKGKGRDKDGGD
jgi:eukaryotic-like serine/threonine-protein kinase